MILALKITFRELYRFISDKNQRIFWKLALKYGDKTRHKEIPVRFLNYKIRVADPESFVWQYKDIFADELYLFDTQNDRPVIFDCGSNIGMSIIYFKQKFPKARIIAYEAHPKVAEILRENLQNNQINDVEINEKAVWVHNNGLEFSDEGADGSSIFGKEAKLQVKSIRLKEELQNFEQIDMLKMDIEGAETEVFKDIEQELKRVENIFVEYHSFYDQQQTLPELLQVLTHAGFRYDIYAIKRLKKSPLLRFNERKSDMDMQLNIFAKRKA